MLLLMRLHLLKAYSSLIVLAFKVVTFTVVITMFVEFVHILGDELLVKVASH